MWVFFFPLYPLSSYQPEAAATGIRAAVLSSRVLFFSLPYSDANRISFGHISPGRIWHCEVVRHGFGTATLPSLFCLSQAIIAGLSIWHLVFCKVLIHLWPPLTTFDHRPKNLIPAQLKLLVHPVCKPTSNTNHHTNWFIVSVRCPAFNLKMLKMSSSASCRCCLVYNSSKDITQSSHLLSIYIHI